MNVYFGSFVACDIMDTIVMIIDKGQELSECGQGCTSWEKLYFWLSIKKERYSMEKRFIRYLSSQIQI